MLNAETQPKHPPLDPSSLDSHAVGAADPMIVFAYACLRREYRTLLAHRPDTQNVPSADAVHRTRIAARRFRVALKLFKDLLPAAAVRSLNRELRWFARALGEVRDLDVYTHHLHAHVADIPGEHPELLHYETQVHAARDAARAALPKLFADPRYDALLTSLAEHLTDAPTSGALRRWRSYRVADGAQPLLENGIARIIKRGNKIHARSHPEDLHRLRIMAKRLRYEFEFFAEIYPSLEKAADTTKRLQDVLGEHQDAWAAIRRLRASIDALGGEAGALVLLLQRHERQAAAAQELFATAWRRFKKSISPGELSELLAA
jgi:CHAD domain-containing protein